MKQKHRFPNVISSYFYGLGIGCFIVGVFGIGAACGITDDAVFTQADWADAEARVTALDAHYREVIDDLELQHRVAESEEGPPIDLDLADATELEGRAVLRYFKTMREAGDGNFPSAIDDGEPDNEPDDEPAE